MLFELFEADFLEKIQKDHIRLRNVYEILYLFRKFNKGINLNKYWKKA